MSKLYSIGELLIDFQSVGLGKLKDTKQFVKNAGGAPANVCVQAAKLGQKTVYLTQVGKDGFGDFLIETLKGEGVDTSHILQTPDYDTSLAFVSFGKDGEREFSFYRRCAADLYFTDEDFKDIAFEQSDMLEFGSVALKTSVSMDAHLSLIERAKEAGATVCFDPNLRFNLWEDKDLLKETVMQFAGYADVIKVGLDELEFLTGTKIPCTELFGDNVKVLLVTDGSRGAKVCLRDGRTYSCGGYKIKAADTTGAGDSCFGGFISGLMDAGVTEDSLLDESVDYETILDFACKCGAYTTMGYGAIPAMGDRETIEKAVK